ncbi:MAG: transposase [Planctomycetaceae bacterium]
MSKSNGSSKSGGRVRRSFSEEFKRDAVSLVTEQGYSLAEAARSLGLHQNLIRNWRLKFVSKKRSRRVSMKMKKPNSSDCVKRIASCEWSETF